MLPVKSSLLPAVSRFFDDDWNNLFDWTNRNYNTELNTLPSVNIKENFDHFLMEIAAPGLKKEDFQIQFHNNKLSIKGETKNQEMEEGTVYARKEFNYQSFLRTFTLSENVIDSTKIEAKYENGILQLLIPKKEEAKEQPARSIEIT